MTTEFFKGTKPQYRAREKRGGNHSHDNDIDRQHQSGLAILSEIFLEYLAIHNYARETIAGHRIRLNGFLRWAQARELFFPAEVDVRVLESYQSHVYRHRKKDGKPLSVTSQRHYINSVKLFFAWLTKKQHIASNPADAIEYPRSTGRPKNLTLTLHEVQKILAQPDLASLYGFRDRTILELMYSSGMRRSEVTKLELANIHFERKIILIRQAKGNKDRFVPVGDRAMQWLTAYHEKVRPVLLQSPTQNTFFLSYYGDPLHPDVLTRIVKKYMKQAEIMREGACHQFRHACATHMLNNGADGRYIQELLGHSDPKSTQIYAQLDISQLQKVHQQCHPLNQAALPNLSSVDH